MQSSVTVFGKKCKVMYEYWYIVSDAASSAIVRLAATDSNRIVQGDCKYSDVHKMTYCETTEIFWR